MVSECLECLLSYDHIVLVVSQNDAYKVQSSTDQWILTWIVTTVTTRYNHLVIPSDLNWLLVVKSLQSAGDVALRQRHFQHDPRARQAALPGNQQKMGISDVLGTRIPGIFSEKWKTWK